MCDDTVRRLEVVQAGNKVELCKVVEQAQMSCRPNMSKLCTLVLVSTQLRMSLVFGDRNSTFLKRM